MSDPSLHPNRFADTAPVAVLKSIPGFVTGVLDQLARTGIEASSLPLSHLCRRVETIEAYHAMREWLMPVCVAVAENDFNGRPISMLLLREPVVVGGGMVELIELPSPKADHPYPNGWEHVGFVVGDVEAFHARHADVLTGIKDRGSDVQAPFITFPDGATAKFYRRTLREIVERDGWRFEPVP